MLFRFRASQAADLGILDISRTKRPKLITSITAIPVCEKWRGQVLKEISRKVSKIQEPSLSDYQIRDINDELNKLFKEKWMWEKQIRDLGGPNYMRGGRVLDDDGKEVPGAQGRGYRYFGRARELPGVKELFEAAASAGKKDDSAKEGAQMRRELAARIDASYFGYGADEDDDELVHYEQGREAEARERLMGMADDIEEDGDVDGRKRKRPKDEEWVELPGDVGDGVGWALPTLEEVQEELVDRRRRRLLDKLG